MKNFEEHQLNFRRFPGVLGVVDTLLARCGFGTTVQSNHYIAALRGRNVRQRRDQECNYQLLISAGRRREQTLAVERLVHSHSIHGVALRSSSRERS